MDRDQERAIEWDCSRVVHEFYAALDEKRYRDLAALFIADGVWNRLGQDLVGPAAILEALDTRADWVTAHVLTNLRLYVQDASTVKTVQYITLYRHEGVAPGSGPQPVVPPLAVLKHQDVLVRDGDGWKFKRKTSRAIMADRGRVTHYAPEAPAMGAG